MPGGARGINPLWRLNIRVAPSNRRSLHRREGSRHQQLTDDVANDLTVRLGLGTSLDPRRIALKRGPFLFTISERFPSQEIGQLLVGFPYQRGEKSGLPDAMLFPNLRRDGLEPFQQRRQPPRDTAIDAHFVDHGLLLPSSCSCGNGSDLSQQSAPSSKAVD